jgi:hypothetical protein
MQYYIYDENGYYAEPGITDNGEMPGDATMERPPDGMWRARWDGERWEETGGPPEEPEEPQARRYTQQEKDEFIEGLMESLNCETDKGVAPQVDWRSHSLQIGAALKSISQPAAELKGAEAPQEGAI